MSNGQQMLLIWLHTGITNLGLSWQPVFSSCKIQSWQRNTALTTDLNVPVFNFCFISFLTDSPAPSAAPKLRVIILLEKLFCKCFETGRLYQPGPRTMVGWVVGTLLLVSLVVFLVNEASLTGFLFIKIFQHFRQVGNCSRPPLVWSGLVMPLHFIKITNKPCLVTLPILK